MNMGNLEICTLEYHLGEKYDIYNKYMENPELLETFAK